MATRRTRIAAVVIGRNEGRRLELSLGSVLEADLPLIYVDSGSSDGSAATARRLDVSVHELDPRRPFSAARARNEGLDEALRRWPEIQNVLFLDGDCVLHPEFPAAATATLDQQSNCAIVTRHLTERHPESPTYNHLSAMDLRGPAAL